MALVRNPETGQLEDDGAPAVDPALGFPSPELTDAGTPPAPPASPVPDAPPAADPAAAAAETPDEVLPPPNPAVPVIPGAQPGLGLAQQVLTAPTVTTTTKLVTPDMKATDARVAAATKGQQDALDQERKNSLEAARIKGNELSLEATRKEHEAQEASRSLAEANRRRADIEAQAARDQASYQAEAARNRAGFFRDPESGGTVAAKIGWGLSLLFGAAAARYGQPNTGGQLLDKALDDWKGDRQRELDRLGKQAAQSGGRLAEFWQQYGAEYQAKKALKDAAGYAQVASEIRQSVADRQNLLTAQAKAEALQKAADLEAKAAADRQRVVDARVGSQEVRQGGQVTTLKVPTPPKGAQAAADKDRAETLLDLDGKVVGKALTPTEGAKIRDAHASARSLISAANDLQSFLRKNGTTSITSPQATQQREILKGKLIAYVTQTYETKTLQDHEFERYSNMLSGKAWQSGDSAAKALEVLKNQAADGYNKKIESQGVKLPGSAVPWGKPGGGAAASGVRQTRTLKNGQTVTGVLRPDGAFEVD